MVLIGLDEEHPITIIEGNHRMTAGMLSSPETLHKRFRVFLGMSARMSEVCWYNGTLGNILRYLKNRLRHMWVDSDADLIRPKTDDDCARNYLCSENSGCPESNVGAEIGQSQTDFDGVPDE